MIYPKLTLSVLNMIAYISDICKKLAIWNLNFQKIVRPRWICFSKSRVNKPSIIINYFINNRFTK